MDGRPAALSFRAKCHTHRLWRTSALILWRNHGRISFTNLCTPSLSVWA
jgi:hypothetical protein